MGRIAGVEGLDDQAVGNQDDGEEAANASEGVTPEAGQAGEVLELVLVNDGQVDHDWVVEGLDGVHAHAGPGQTARVRFTAEAGTYRVLCTESGHDSAGMVGLLVIEP